MQTTINLGEVIMALVGILFIVIGYLLKQKLEDIISDLKTLTERERSTAEAVVGIEKQLERQDERIRMALVNREDMREMDRRLTTVENKVDAAWREIDRNNRQAMT